MTRDEASRGDPALAVDKAPEAPPSRPTPATPLTVPQPTPAALAALEVSQDRENVESALSVLAGVIRRGEGWSPYCELAIVAASASLAALLAAARHGAGETARLRERYREACEALARKHNNPECACVFCEDLRAARAAHPNEETGNAHQSR